MSPPRRDSSSRLRIVVVGYIVRGPLGGLVWHHLQYVMGLARLGHDVWFVEDSDDVPWSCYDPTRDVTDADPTYGLAFTARTFDRVGLGERWAYHDAHTRHWLGPAADRILEVCASADLLLDVSCESAMRPWLLDIPVRVAIDTDPAFTQVRNLTEPDRRARCETHNRFFSFGENIAGGTSTVPDDGLPWQPTRQPVVLDAWPVTVGRPRGPFTTVMQWDSYPAREYASRRYGMKSASFETLLDLPRHTPEILELALGGGTAPRDLLIEKGWRLRSSLEPTTDPWTYQQYLQRSKAEFTVAKHGYAVSRSGWFSERSAVYLASGRPVVTQDTGFGDVLPVGRGLLAFESPEEASAAIADIATGYAAHCRAAREIAEAYFDSGTVLGDLLDVALATEGPASWPPARTAEKQAC